jgi:CelD/BcsL family acetyltransferase involved in cellulose biosynthesis
VRLETVTSLDDLERLAGWDDLVSAMRRPSPYLLHGWLIEWWRHYGADGELAVHVVRRDDRLVAALPLCIRRRLACRVTEFVGGTWALLADVLAAPGEDAAAKALVQYAASWRHDFADLFGLPSSSRLVSALPPDAVRVIERLESPVLDLTPGWDVVYEAKLSSKARSERRRRLRQLGALGQVELSVARTPEEIGPALEEVFRVHRLRWEGRHDPTGFVTPTGLAFHGAAFRRLAEQGIPRIVLLRLDGKAIAFALTMQVAGRAYGVTMGFDPAYARYGPGFEAKLYSLEAAAADGITEVELLGAAADHKRRFTDRLDPIHQAIGLARTVRGRVTAEALTGGVRLRWRMKRSQTARKIYARIPLHARSHP